MGNTCSVCDGTYSSPYILLADGAVCRYCQDAVDKGTGGEIELYRPPPRRPVLDKGCAVVAFAVIALPTAAATAWSVLG